MVEFLTPSFRPEEGIRDLPALGVSAQSRHFLNCLIGQPIKAAALYRSGVLVQIPRPEAFAIHKLIAADRRRGGPDQIRTGRRRRCWSRFWPRTAPMSCAKPLRARYRVARIGATTSPAVWRGCRKQPRVWARFDRRCRRQDRIGHRRG